jgi:hypothetical protein
MNVNVHHHRHHHLHHQRIMIQIIGKSNEENIFI